MSEKWQSRANSVLAQSSTGTNSKRISQYVRGVYPTHCHMGQGPYMWGVDDRRYIDFVGGLGSIILGYNHPRVTEAVQDVISKGIISGSLPHPLEVEVGEMVQNMFPPMEKIRFLKTGSEACSAAVRIARSYTNEGYIKSSGYHGHHDLFTSLTPPAIGVMDNFKIIKNRSRNAYGRMAAMIVEPIETDDSLEVKRKLQDEMEFAREQDALVIFDEVITGCRVPGYSVAKMWKLDPDIIVLGKAIANGYPLSIVGGKKKVMDSKEYFISSTFSGEAMSLAACKATLTELRTKNMKDLMFYAKRFMETFNDMCSVINVKIEGYGTRGMMRVTDENTALFMQEACKGGLFFGKAFFYNFSHMEEGIEEYVFNIISDIVNRIKVGSVKMEGAMPQETFKR